MTKTIMVVDDEKDVRDTVRTVLEKNKYKVITAVNGDDCLKKLEKQKVDLILMDIMMPGTPVKDIITKIKDTKIIYLTVVLVSEAEREDLLNQKNVAGFIQKPYNIDHLLSAVKKVVGNHNNHK